MKKIILILVLSLFVFLKGNSQNLAIDSANAEIVLPDTVNYNDNLNHTLIVDISGGVSYSGIVYLVAAVDSSNGNQSIDTIATRNVSNKLNDTIMFTYNEIYNNSNAYRVGGNVVVIWPIAATLITLDTFNTNITVVQVVGIDEDKTLYNSIIIYPNPTKDYFYIKNKGQNNKLKQVRIFDVNGRLVYIGKSNPKIDVSNLKKGVYFINLELENQTLLHYKLIKDE